MTICVVSFAVPRFLHGMTFAVYPSSLSFVARIPILVSSDCPIPALLLPPLPSSRLPTSPIPDNNNRTSSSTIRFESISDYTQPSHYSHGITLQLSFPTMQDSQIWLNRWNRRWMARCCSPNQRSKSTTIHSNLVNPLFNTNTNTSSCNTSLKLLPTLGTGSFDLPSTQPINKNSWKT